MAWFGLALKGAGLALSAIGMFRGGGGGTALILNEVLLQLRDVNSSLLDIHETLLDVKSAVDALPDNQATKQISADITELVLRFDSFNLEYDYKVSQSEDYLRSFELINQIRVDADSLIIKLNRAIAELENPRFFLRLYRATLALVPITILLNRQTYIPSIFISQYFPSNTQVDYDALKILGPTKGQLLASFKLAERTTRMVAPNSSNWEKFVLWSAVQTGFKIELRDGKIRAEKELRRRNIFPIRYSLDFDLRGYPSSYRKNYLYIILDIDVFKVDFSELPKIESDRISATPPDTKGFRQEYEEYAEKGPKTNIIHDASSTARRLDFDGQDRGLLGDPADGLAELIRYSRNSFRPQQFLNSLGLDHILTEHGEKFEVDFDEFAEDDFQRIEETVEVASLYGFLNYSGEFLAAQILLTSDISERISE